MVGVDVVIVGGGPAGISAACTTADAGLSVFLCDQNVALGGAVHRRLHQNAPPLGTPTDLAQNWKKLKERLNAHSERIEIRTSTIFTGLDSTGVAVFRDHSTNTSTSVRPRAVIFATGAFENIRPIPGWRLPGVVTAGGLQIQAKSAATTPSGRILVAGSGPLLLAVATQLASLGNSPIAVIESGKPLQNFLRFSSLPFPYIREAASYYIKLRSRRIPWIRGSELIEIRKVDGHLQVVTKQNRGNRIYNADIVALHNGLCSNNVGLPKKNLNVSKGVLVEHAGDCDKILGARGAIASGASAAGRVLAALEKNGHQTDYSFCLHREAAAQATLASIFHSDSFQPLKRLPDHVVLCACEQQTVGDIRKLVASGATTAREARLLGRIGMGRCQGRFCKKWALELINELSDGKTLLDKPESARWPIRPVTIGSLAKLKAQTESIAAEPDTETQIQSNTQETARELL